MAQQPPRQDRQDRPPIEGSLSAAATYRLGDAIELTFSIQNSGTTPYQVLVWGTPLEDEVNDFLTLERDGRILRYDGRFVKYGDPIEQDYVVLGPNETLTRTVDISRSYPIDAPGVYRATLKVTLFDAFPVPGAAKQAPRLRSQHQLNDVPSTTVEFTVLPDGQPKQTDGHAVRAANIQGPPQQTYGQAARPANIQSPPQADDGNGDVAVLRQPMEAKAASFNGGTAAQQAETLIAHANAQHFTALAVSQLTTTAGTSNTLYLEWFGAFDPARYDKVTDNYSDINKVIATETITYDLTFAGCRTNWYAYTYPGSRTVWLCNLYLSAPQTGADCKFGVIIHELSHAVSYTDDYAYGESAARDLARTDPGKAIDNADNHEYFTEHL